MLRMSCTTCVTHRRRAARILLSLHVIDAVRVCLACGVNVHRLVPVSASCCPLHMFARFLCLHYNNVQTSSHTIDNHLSIRTHTHLGIHARPISREPHLRILSQAVYKISRNISGVLSETKGLGGGAAETFFSSAFPFPHFPLQQMSQ